MTEYKCDVCGREFKRAQNLKWHKLWKHNGGEVEKKEPPKPEKKKDEDVSPCCKADLRVIQAIGGGRYIVECTSCGKRYNYTEED
jgi:hypothetical protein